MPPGMTPVASGEGAGPLAARHCAPVAWIYSADYASRATCFLIHAEWILTAGHVLMREEKAADSIVVFNYLDGTRPDERDACVLCPELGFISKLEPLDFCAVRVCASGARPGDRWGTIDLASATAATTNTQFTCVQHPNDGNVKAWSRGEVTGRHEGLLTHDAPCMKGSSGAPMLDDAGRLVGIHTGEAPPWIGGSRAVAATDVLARLRAAPDLPIELRDAIGHD